MVVTWYVDCGWRPLTLCLKAKWYRVTVSGWSSLETRVQSQWGELVCKCIKVHNMHLHACYVRPTLYSHTQYRDGSSEKNDLIDVHVNTKSQPIKTNVVPVFSLDKQPSKLYGCYCDPSLSVYVSNYKLFISLYTTLVRCVAKRKCIIIIKQ